MFRNTGKEQQNEKRSDEELIEAVRQGDSGSVIRLLERYKYLVRGKAKLLHMLGGDHEDMIQEGMIGLYQAIRDYDPGREASFSTFANICVSRQLYTAVQSSGRKKHFPLNSAISLDSEVELEKGEGREKAGSLGLLLSGKNAQPEERLIARENMDLLLERIEKELSSFEKQVLNLYLSGANYTQISERLKRPEKSIDNALQRIRTKLRKQH